MDYIGDGESENCPLWLYYYEVNGFTLCLTNDVRPGGMEVSASAAGRLGLFLIPTVSIFLILPLRRWLRTPEPTLGWVLQCHAHMGAAGSKQQQER